MYRYSRSSSTREFERVVMPHLPSAYNLARWLLRADADAEDVVQDACVNAYRRFADFRGGDARAWLLAIVRNSSYTLLRKRQSRASEMSLDDLFDDPQFSEPGPEASALRADDAGRLREAIEAMPAEFREMIVLREVEDLSYKDIAEITGLPVGTVMSRLSRARKRLRAFASPFVLEQAHDV